jgi:hypothetical protein
MKWQFPLFAVALLLSGCGQVRDSSRLAQPLDRSLVAGVGDTVIEIDMRESLPNAFGNADIFGRTRPKGKIIVTYLGLDQGRASFERLTIRLQSNATTMNSSPIIIPQTSTTTYSGSTNVIGTAPAGTFSGTALSSGVATTTAPPIVLPPSGSETQVISNDRIRYYLDLNKDRNLFIEGKEILIEQATVSSVKYRIKKLN